MSLASVANVWEYFFPAKRGRSAHFVIACDPGMWQQVTLIIKRRPLGRCLLVAEADMLVDEADMPTAG